MAAKFRVQLALSCDSHMTTTTTLYIGSLIYPTFHKSITMHVSCDSHMTSLFNNYTQCRFHMLCVWKSIASQTTTLNGRTNIHPPSPSLMLGGSSSSFSEETGEPVEPLGVLVVHPRHALPHQVLQYGLGTVFSPTEVHSQSPHTGEG